MRRIPAAFQSLSEYIARDADCDPSFAGTILIFFGVIGFFAVYLLTRLYLAAAFGRADQRGGEFASSLRKLTGAAESFSDDSDDDETNDVSTTLAQLIEVSPAAAVSMAFREFEEATRNAAQEHGLQPEKGTQRTISQLANAGVLQRQQVEAAGQLRTLRNIAAHEGDRSITQADAEEYIQLASRLTKGMRDASKAAKGDTAST